MHQQPPIGAYCSSPIYDSICGKPPPRHPENPFKRKIEPQKQSQSSRPLTLCGEMIPAGWCILTVAIYLPPIQAYKKDTTTRFYHFINCLPRHVRIRMGCGRRRAYFLLCYRNLNHKTLVERGWWHINQNFHDICCAVEKLLQIVVRESGRTSCP